MTSTIKTLPWSCALAMAMLSTSALAQAQQQPARPAVPRAVQPNGSNTQQGVPQQGNRQQFDAQQGNRQQTNAQQRVTANKPAGDEAMSNDQMIANWVMTANQVELAVARAAESKVQNKDVRKFAAMLIQEHTPVTEQMEKFGATPVQFGEGHRSDATTTERTAAGAPARPMHAGEVHRQIAQRCVATAEKELNDAKGKERDECFLGMQIGAHHEMINSQKVLREYASPELRAVLDKSIQTAESHLEHAKHLIRELAGNDDGKPSREDDSK